MLKRVVPAPEGVADAPAAQVCSVSGCISACFTNYVPHWRHNGFFLFDAPEIALQVAAADGVALRDLTLFYYEAHELAFEEGARRWIPVAPRPEFATAVVSPRGFEPLGYDVVTFSVDTSPECSPLSCCGLAREAHANRFCLLDSLEDAKQRLDAGFFDHSEPGPFRIYSVWRSPLALT